MITALCGQYSIYLLFNFDKPLATLEVMDLAERIRFGGGSWWILITIRSLGWVVRGLMDEDMEIRDGMFEAERCKR